MCRPQFVDPPELTTTRSSPGRFRYRINFNGKTYCHKDDWGCSENLLADAHDGEPVTICTDNNCNVLDGCPPNFNLCGGATRAYTVHWCPISLVWEKELSQQSSDPVVINTFQLSPDQKGEWITWKASEDRPLLVYLLDVGVTKLSWENLFGQYTFGKRWENGFAALRSLDRDSNGTLEGKEFENLYLWFDRDQDGILDEGELVDVKSSGLKTLNVQGRPENTIEGDLILEDGFERELRDGQVVSGAMLDWYSYDYQKAADAGSYVEVLKERKSLLEERVSGGEKSSRSIEGKWTLSIDGAGFAYQPVVQATEQWIMFIETEEAQVFDVVSFALTQLDSGPTHKAYRPVLVGGEARERKEEPGVYDITILDPASNSVTISTAHLSADGKTLVGTSDAKISGNDATAHRYTWEANKFADISLEEKTPRSDEELVARDLRKHDIAPSLFQRIGSFIDEVTYFLK